MENPPKETPADSSTLKTEPKSDQSKIHPLQEQWNVFKFTGTQLLLSTDIQKPKPIKSTPIVYITTKQGLEDAILDLEKQPEIGVDLEYSDHGYKALTCLIQISTMEKDYIIDTIALKSDTALLKPLFCNPTIVKIFHSAHNDLKWLQQDFEIFVINMFDTQKAMRALNYTNVGLKEELLKYNVSKDKRMQRADFRRRPLPQDFLDYARTDSHFLIHMYHTLKNKLIGSRLLEETLLDCKEQCKIVTEQDANADTTCAWIESSLTQKHLFQLSILKKLNEWRHRVAQEEDVNPGYVLSKTSFKNLVTFLPKERHAINATAKSKYVARDMRDVMHILTSSEDGDGAEAPSTVPSPRDFKRKFQGSPRRGGKRNKFASRI